VARIRMRRCLNFREREPVVAARRDTVLSLKSNMKRPVTDLRAGANCFVARDGSATRPSALTIFIRDPFIRGASIKNVYEKRPPIALGFFDRPSVAISTRRVGRLNFAFPSEAGEEVYSEKYEISISCLRHFR